MRRIVINVAKNQQRFGVTADGDDVLRVQCAAFDWEAELERERRQRAAFDASRGGGRRCRGGGRRRRRRKASEVARLHAQIASVSGRLKRAEARAAAAAGAAPPGSGLPIATPIDAAASPIASESDTRTCGHESAASTPWISASM